LRIAVIDSSSLIALAHLELARTLGLFFDIIYVSSAVQENSIANNGSAIASVGSIRAESFSDAPWSEEIESNC
jgi:hypothetical protein